MTIDRSSWWWRKGRPLLTTVVSLVIAGIMLEPLQNKAWGEVRARQPELNLKDLGDNLGQGTLLGVLGGFRSIVADFVWIRGDVYWEKKTDRAATEACVQLAATLDPHNLMFWDDGSSMIGYDIPSWRRWEQPPPTETEMDEINRAQALRAIDFLDRGLKFVPNSFRLLMDKAQIYQFRLKDYPKAAEAYREAADSTNNPFLAARNYIRLLRKLHRDQEAYDYLVKDFYPKLPNGVPEVQKGLMWGWIRGLEEALKIPPDQRQPDSKAPPDWKAEDYMDDFVDLSHPKS